MITNGTLTEKTKSQLKQRAPQLWLLLASLWEYLEIILKIEYLLEANLLMIQNADWNRRLLRCYNNTNYKLLQYSNKVTFTSVLGTLTWPSASLVFWVVEFSSCVVAWTWRILVTIADQGSGKFVFASNVKTKNRNTESKKWLQITIVTLKLQTKHNDK